MLYSVLTSALQFLLNLNHHQGKLQVDDDDLVKLKVQQHKNCCVCHKKVVLS